ncbi:MAG: sortase [Patescibacteria group bacterium]
MKPENSSSGGDLSNSSPSNPPTNQDATANVLRSQIDSMYGGNSVASAQATTSNPSQPEPAAQTADPYSRTHNQHPLPQEEQWKQYHSAWQTYYQKYYEGYYAAQKPQAEQQPVHQQPTSAIGTGANSNGFFTQQTDFEETTEELNKDQALLELREKLLGKVQNSAKKIRKSRHFIPIAASLVVVLIFVFLQYNRVFIASVNAYVSPGAISPQNIVIDPSGDAPVGMDPRLIIPKINVDVPAIYGVGNDYDSQMAAMEKGVAHFAIPGASSHPGEIGNTVLSGHSSNDLFDGGDYKFIFAQLEKLTVGDTIYTNYEGKRYTYVVTKTEVVKPTEVSKLIYPTDKPILTLITCTPLGTALNRLLVTAEQVSPDPARATQAPANDGSASDATIPGNSQTFFERIFGAN